jgi:uncharacterized protein (DUF1697 family)
MEASARIDEGIAAVAGRQVALIRGINVGRAKRVAMAELRALVEELGYHDVRTLLNSGNVVFTTPRMAPGHAAARIEKALAAKLGVSARVTVLTTAELAAIVAENPLGEIANDASRLLVCVLADPANRSKLKPMSKLDWGDECLAIGSRVVYLWCPDGILASRLPEAVHRLLGDAVTTRNWATVTKLQALTEDRR